MADQTSSISATTLDVVKTLLHVAYALLVLALTGAWVWLWVMNAQVNLAEGDAVATVVQAVTMIGPAILFAVWFLGDTFDLDWSSLTGIGR